MLHLRRDLTGPGVQAKVVMEPAAVRRAAVRHSPVQRVGMRPDPLVRFDPATETFQSWAIPSGGVYSGILRHMRANRDGNLLIHQSATNRIIQVNVQRRDASR
jgi:hypothetical protein